MIDLISSYLNQGLGIIVPMIVLLGLLIFVHELGHFLAAKFFKVRVETFSLGFGPKILKFIKGDTTYCISAFPLGGYVKMYGDEPGKEVPDELKNVSFLDKPVGQRFIIALAGPVMNLFFAAVLFYFVAQVGDKALAPIVGEIAENTQAYDDGFRPNDRILAVGDKNVETWDQFQRMVEQSADKQMPVQVQRGDEELTVRPIPIEVKNKDILSSANRVGEITGLNNEVHLPTIGIEPGSNFERAGLKNGDHLTEVNGQKIKYFKDIAPAMAAAFKNGSKEVFIKAKRYESFTKRDAKFDNVEARVGVNPTNIIRPGIFIPQAMVAEVKEESPAANAGIKVFDRIEKINGNQIYSFRDIIKHVSSYQKDDPPLKILIKRGRMSKTLEMIPESTDLEGQYGITENRYTIGIIPLKNATRQTFVWKADSISRSFKHAFTETYRWTKVTLLSFWRMIQGRVPAKNIGGFISIGQVAHTSWQIGLGAFLKIMAIISINLFILNLLPIPILDGGHLMLFTLEAIKGSPLSLRKIEVAQQIGFLFILFLMAFALFNDFSRIFGS